MALPKSMRLKGHRTFKYIHRNSKKIYGDSMDLRITKSNPRILSSHNIKYGISNFKLAISVSKKVSKKSVTRNKIRRFLQDKFLENFKKEYAHIPYWVLVNLKGGISLTDKEELLKEFQFLFSKSGLLK